MGKELYTLQLESILGELGQYSFMISSTLFLSLIF